MPGLLFPITVACYLMDRGDRDPTIPLFTHPLSLPAIILGKTLGKSSHGNWPGRPTMANLTRKQSRPKPVVRNKVPWPLVIIQAWYLPW